MTLFRLCLPALLIVAAAANAKEIDTNSVHMANAPEWLTRPRVEKVIDRIQTHLEWTIRKIETHWYADAVSFSKSHGLGPMAMAVSKKSDNTIHMGPMVTSANFDAVFGHELVHIILGQKYKDAIPKWLEEGLANHLAKYGKVDYAWLKKQSFPDDVRTLTHPYSGAVNRIHYHYIASQALAEMIAKKCDLSNLLRLSVERNMEDYLSTYCEIKDLNAEFKTWVKKKG